MRARPLVVTVVAVAIGVLVAAAFWLAARDAAPDATVPPPPHLPAPVAAPSSPPTPAPGPPTPARRPVDIDTPGYWSWALLDRTTLELTTGPEPGTTSSTESMIKIWIVADTLRGYSDWGDPPPAEALELASAAIRRSDDGAAETLYRAGGGDEVIGRLIDICGLTDTTAYPGWWSRTEMSARDAVRMGLCVADGRAAGPEWTEWVLAEMRQVEGTATAADQPLGGRWGIIDALPADQAARLAIKNGWTPVWADGAWHVSCLAIADDWIMAVQARYPVDLGLEHGVAVCRDLARQVLA